MRRGTPAGFVLGLLSLTALIAGASANAAPGVPHSGHQTAAHLPSGAVDDRIDAGHDSDSRDPSFVPPLKRLWTDTLPAPVEFDLLAGNRAFVVYGDQDNSDTDDVESMDADDGDVVWGPVAVSPSGPDTFLAYENGRLFITTFDGTVEALDAATGAVDWQTTAPYADGSDVPPTAFHGHLFINAGEILVYNARTGSLANRYKYQSDTEPTLDRGGLANSYCPYSEISPVSGSPRWTNPDVPLPICQRDATYAAADGRIWLRSYEDDVPGAALSERTGAVTNLFEPEALPAFDGSTIVLSDGRDVQGIDLQSGVQLWQRGFREPAALPIIADGYVVLSDIQGRVALLNDRTGAVAWSQHLANDYSALNSSGWQLGESEGRLLVPLGDQVTAFASSTRPHLRITSGPGQNSWTRSRATFGFVSNRPAASYRCELNDRAQSCHSPWHVSGLHPGRQHVRIWIVGHPKAYDERDFDVDLVPPTAAVKPRFIKPYNPVEIAFALSGHDGQSAVADFSVRVKITYVGAKRPAVWQRPPFLQSTAETAPTMVFPRKQPVRICVSARARDLAGNSSAWSPATCAVNRGFIKSHARKAKR